MIVARLQMVVPIANVASCRPQEISWPAKRLGKWNAFRRQIPQIIIILLAIWYLDQYLLWGQVLNERVSNRTLPVVPITSTVTHVVTETAAQARFTWELVRISKEQATRASWNTLWIWDLDIRRRRCGFGNNGICK